MQIKEVLSKKEKVLVEFKDCFATDRRVIKISNSLFKSEVEDFSYKHISSISIKEKTVVLPLLLSFFVFLDSFFEPIFTNVILIGLLGLFLILISFFFKEGKLEIKSAGGEIWATSKYYYYPFLFEKEKELALEFERVIRGKSKKSKQKSTKIQKFNLDIIQLISSKNKLFKLIAIILLILIIFLIIINLNYNQSIIENKPIEKTTSISEKIEKRVISSEKINQEGIIAPYCGNNVCDLGESCSTCSIDCGVCSEEVLTKIKNTIVWVKYEFTGKNADGSYFSKSASGSGVIINNENNELIIYTNRHVIDCGYTENCFQRLSEKSSIRTQDGTIHNVNEWYFAPHNLDMAILKIKTSNAKNYQVAYYTDEIKEGETVTAIGYPVYASRVVEFSISEGKITKIKDLLMDDGFAFNSIESDAYTNFGSSGGRLFNKTGSLVGVTTWGKTQESLAIKISSIKNSGQFIYCEKNSYSTTKGCVKYCNRNEILGTGYRCYKPCEDFYCNTQHYIINDQRCKDTGYILGTDGYCHQPCVSPTNYCTSGSYCYNNNCISCPFGTYLFEDGTCRKYE